MDMPEIKADYQAIDRNGHSFIRPVKKVDQAIECVKFSDVYQSVPTSWSERVKVQVRVIDRMSAFFRMSSGKGA